MSAFKTCIPVDVDGVRKLLPKESFVESVDWNPLTQQVEVTWSNRNCVTPWSVPIEFPIQMLQDKALPKGAAIKTSPIAPEMMGNAAIVTDNVKPVDRKRGKGVKVVA